MLHDARKKRQRAKARPCRERSTPTPLLSHILQDQISSHNHGRLWPRRPPNAGESHRKGSIRTYLCRVTAITPRYDAIPVPANARNLSVNVYVTGSREYAGTRRLSGAGHTTASG